MLTFTEQTETEASSIAERNKASKLDLRFDIFQTENPSC